MSVFIVAKAEVNPVEAVGIDELRYPACLTPIDVHFFGKASNADFHEWYYETTGSISCEDFNILGLGIVFSFQCREEKFLQPDGEQTLAQIDFEIRQDASLGTYSLSIPDHMAEFSVLGGSRHEPTVEIVDSVRVGIHLGEEGLPLPKTFSLSQNYPNPFNSTTLIRYAIPGVSGQPSVVSLEIFNISGQKVATLVDEKQTLGYKTAAWDAEDLASGIYFYRLKSGEFTAIKKMVLLK